MTGPVYKLVLADFTEAWHQLSQEERESLWAKNEEAFEEAGGKRLLLCDSRWSSEEWIGFAIEEFPDIEAHRKYVKALEDQNWWRYTKGKTILGTKWERELP